MIVKVDSSNVGILAELAHKLWPEDNVTDLLGEFKDSLGNQKEDSYLYVNHGNKYLGFIQLSIRQDYVEGSNTSPVAYVEGIYVEESARRQGIAQELMVFAEKWSKSKGCYELGSDCELNNILSIDFHKGTGFHEANRIVCFIKKL